MTAEPLQNLDQLEEALLQAGLDPVSHRRLLEQVRSHLGRYVRLETELLGHVSIPVPRHLLGTPPPGESRAAVENLAHQERERLEIAQGTTDTLLARLDREGLKVYRAPFPLESPLSGFFLFDRDVGPVLVVDESLKTHDADLVFARLYGHYLMDNDPYEIRLAMQEPTFLNAATERAREFAGAFLIDKEELDRYLDGLAWSPEDSLTDEVLGHLTAYFNVGPQAVKERLFQLQYLHGIAEPEADAQGSGSGDGEEHLLPERFVRLALEAHAREVISLETLALHLEADTASALRLADRFRLEEPETGEEREKDTPDP